MTYDLIRIERNSLAKYLISLLVGINRGDRAHLNWKQL